MPEIFSLLASIPAVVWSGIGGAITALSGVLISNRSNTARLRHQLQHDANEKAKERTATLRREVYLRMVEELAKANAHLSSLPNLDPSKVNIGEGLQGFFSAAARLQLVAEPKTVLLVNKLVGEYGEFLIDLMAFLQPVHVARADIQIADHHYSQAQTEVTRVLGEMTKLNELGKPNPEVFRALQTSFDFHQGQCEKFAAARDAAWSKFNAVNLGFQRAVVAKFRDLAPRQVPVMIELRRDLGLNCELDGLEAQLRQQMQRLEERFEAFVAQIGAG